MPAILRPAAAAAAQPQFAQAPAAPQKGTALQGRHVAHMSRDTDGAQPAQSKNEDECCTTTCALIYSCITCGLLNACIRGITE